MEGLYIFLGGFGAIILELFIEFIAFKIVPDSKVNDWQYWLVRVVAVIINTGMAALIVFGTFLLMATTEKVWPGISITGNSYKEGIILLCVGVAIFIAQIVLFIISKIFWYDDETADKTPQELSASNEASEDGAQSLHATDNVGKDETLSKPDTSQVGGDGATGEETSSNKPKKTVNKSKQNSINSNKTE